MRRKFTTKGTKDTKFVKSTIASKRIWAKIWVRNVPKVVNKFFIMIIIPRALPAIMLSSVFLYIRSKNTG